MPTFDTPEPITVRVDAAAGSIRLVATLPMCEQPSRSGWSATTAS